MATDQDDVARPRSFRTGGIKRIEQDATVTAPARPGGKSYGGIGRAACPPGAVMVGELMHFRHLSGCVGVSAPHGISRQTLNNAAYDLDWSAACCQLSKE
jgi:hypothetical protein